MARFKLRPTYSLEEISKMVTKVAPEPYVIFILYFTIILSSEFMELDLDEFKLVFSFIMVYLKLNGAFWANCTIFKKKIRLNK